MKIVITGSSGFLGGVLCRKLEEQGHQLLCLNSKNCDLTRQESLHSLPHEKFDQIFHLAAWTQPGDFCLYHPGEQWIINQQINSNVLSWWYSSQPQAKLICIGTSCAYDPALELVEQNYLVGLPIESLFSYAMTKRMLYAGLLVLNKQFGLKYLHVVPSTLYGPGYSPDGKQMHFIFDIIRKVIRGKVDGGEVVLWGDGYQRREVVYVEDFVGILLRLNEFQENDTVNIGAGMDLAIRDFARLVCNKVGYDFNDVKFDPARYVGAKSKLLSVNKLKKLLPDFKMTPLDTGLAITIDWFFAQR